MRRLIIALVLLLALPAALALGQNAPAPSPAPSPKQDRQTGVEMPPLVAPHPSSPDAFSRVISCIRLTTHPRVCEKSCTTWANGQPDFDFSYGICVQKCHKDLPCDN